MFYFYTTNYTQK